MNGFKRRELYLQCKGIINHPDLVPIATADFCLKEFGVESFSPADISNGIAWFYGGKGIALNGGDVSGWEDQFSNGNDLSQPTASEQPLFIASDPSFNNKPVVSFDGVNENMFTSAFSAELAQPNTIFFVCKFNALGPIDLAFDGLSSTKRNAFQLAGSAGNPWALYAGDEILGQNSDTNVHVFGCQYNTTSSKIFAGGGSPNGLGNVGSQNMDGLVMATYYDRIGLFSNMNIAELIIYDKLLSDSEMDQVGQYLAIKYGMTWVETNLGAWYESSEGITLNGPDVSQWDDKSGNDHHLVQTTAADQPLFVPSDSDFNDKPAIQFDGVNEFMDTSAFAAAQSQPNTILFVAKLESLPAGFIYLVDGINGASEHLIGVHSTGSVWRIRAGNSLLGSSANTSLHVFVARFNTTLSTFHVDGGAADISGDAGSNSLTGLTLGTSSSHSIFVNMSIAELKLYTKLLTDSEVNIKALELATKYGTTWTDI